MPSLAFALAGLGGFNAHGAGFLTAARELEVRPDLITATSGQIVVVADWLDGQDLAAALIDPSRPSGPFGTLLTAARGLPGVFRPAVTEYWRRWFPLPTSWGDVSAALLPAQEFVPLRTPEALDRMAGLLNGSDIGIVFNAYDPKNGEGRLFGNDAARAALPAETLAAITGASIEAALWLSLYGFDPLPGGLMDGAYHRSCIIAELTGFDRIFAVRPLAQGWRDKAPATWFDAQDWQTEMWFSASYDAEVADMTRINTLLGKEGVVLPGYRAIDLVPVLVDHAAGFFNFFGERRIVFDNGRRIGREKLIRHLGLQAAADPPADA